jgi:iron-sulfur cluster repair protein YtfE (RIC family)
MPIKRHNALQPLSRDHHHGLILAQLIKKGAPAYKGLPISLKDKKDYVISFYNSELKKHFKKEEEILFPPAKNRTPEVDILINEIVEEHSIIEKLVNEIQKTTDLEKVLDELGWLLEKHIRKEERSLFGEIENLLTNDELEELKIKLIEQ